MFKTLLLGVLFLLIAERSGSQTNYPEWIVSPTGDTLLGFTAPQTQVLGEKLVLKNYLIEKNYELTKLYELCSERNDALSGALRLREDEIAKLEHEISLTASRLATIDGEIARLNKELEKADRRKKIWKGACTALAGVITALSVILMI